MVVDAVEKGKNEWILGADASTASHCARLLPHQRREAQRELVSVTLHSLCDAVGGTVIKSEVAKEVGDGRWSRRGADLGLASVVHVLRLASLHLHLDISTLCFTLPCFFHIEYLELVSGPLHDTYARYDMRQCTRSLETHLASY